MQGIASETATVDPTTEIATPTVTKKRGFFQRAVDSFKPPLDQKGWVPDRIPRGEGKRVYVDRVPDDPEKGAGTVARDTHVDVNKQGGLTGVLHDDSLDDNGGLKRALHGRHLQVNRVTSILAHFGVTRRADLYPFVVFPYCR